MFTQAVGDPQKASHWRNRFVQSATQFEGRSPNSQAPTFETGNCAGNDTAAYLRATTPHAGMPMFQLTAEQREDIIAYILSLR